MLANFTAARKILRKKNRKEKEKEKKSFWLAD